MLYKSRLSFFPYFISREREREREREGGGGGREDSAVVIDGETTERHRARERVTPNRPLEEQQRVSRQRIPFSYGGGDIGFTSTQGSSYDDACATYPISGAAQESDFSSFLFFGSSILFRLLYFPRSHRTLRVKRS